ncbi:hypothetical protein LCGC14_1320080 [marine sediment metagenome]|uniref:Uncharacterized protein n=1 Tax=marine sediment metagenome TaxID=412755 RepID=A0A0F9KJV2_9ZZZZ
MFKFDPRTKQIVNGITRSGIFEVEHADKLRATLLDLSDAIRDVCQDEEAFNNIVNNHKFGVSSQGLTELKTESHLLFEFPTSNFKPHQIMLNVLIQKEGPPPETINFDDLDLTQEEEHESG